MASRRLDKRVLRARRAARPDMKALVDVMDIAYNAFRAKALGLVTPPKPPREEVFPQLVRAIVAIRRAVNER